MTPSVHDVDDLLGMNNIFLIFVDMSKHLKYSQSESKNLNTQSTVTAAEKWELAAGIIWVDSPAALVFMQSFTAFHRLSHFQSFFPLSTLFEPTGRENEAAKDVCRASITNQLQAPYQVTRVNQCICEGGY